MKSFIITLIINLVLGIVLPLSGQKLPPTQHAKIVEAHRKELHREFKDKKTSPLPEDKIKNFKGLSYYPIDYNYYLEATFVLDTTARPFKMQTSTARLPDYVKYGELHFNLHNKPLVLSVYQSLELIQNQELADYLFIPFTDTTNGKGTYGGGRYLDFKIPKSERVTIDFNLAYNPYCAYSLGYSCPVPPQENQLPVCIEAGVKSDH